AQFSKGESYQPFSYPNFLAYRDWNAVFDGLLASYDVQFDLSDGDSAQSVAGQYVSENYFEVLGLRPIRGRFIYPKTMEDSEHADVAVISYGLWRSRFGGSADVIGTIIHLQGVQVTVIGILVMTASLFLLVACANVGGLLLAKATTRGKEIAIRSALGATRRRLIRLLLTETLLLFVLGGVAGLLVSHWAKDVLAAIIAFGPFHHLQFLLDYRVAGLSFGLSLLT